MIKNLIKRIIIIFIVIAVIVIVSFIMLKYSVEGEKNLPFSISKLLIVSTVDGQVNDDQENLWNISIEQVNDIYIYIDKTVDKDITIKQISLENYEIEENSNIGNIKLYRPTGDLSNLYKYSQEDYFSKGLTYLGSSIDDMKSLEISNDGGVIGFRLSLTDLGQFISNEEQEISYDGSLLSGLDINSIDDISFKVSFDIIITTSENINFRGRLNLSLPLENIIEEGTANKEITNFENVVFKRIK